MRLTPSQLEELLRMLETYESAGDVAVATGLPLRTVIHYQRLYGPISMQLQRAKEDRRRIEELKRQALQETGTFTAARMSMRLSKSPRRAVQ